MSRRMVKIMAVVNVLAVAGLYVWYELLPAQRSGDPVLLQVIREAEKQKRDLPLFELLELAADRIETLESQLRSYSYLALTAGAVLLVNAGVFGVALMRVEAAEAAEKDEAP